MTAGDVGHLTRPVRPRPRPDTHFERPASRPRPFRQRAVPQWRYEKDRNYVLPLTVLLAVALVAAIVVGVVMVTRDSSPTTSARHGAPPAPAVVVRPAAQVNVAQAVTWMSHNVRRSASILADTATARRLQTLGYVDATDAPGAPVSWVVLDATVRAAPALYDVTGTLSRITPVAEFGSGDAVVQVSSVLGGTSDHVAELIAQDRSNRVAAGRQLVANPSIHAGTVLQDLLRGGRLDLRAAAFLAQLASTTSVTLVVLPQTSYETVAGRAIRTVEISAAPAAIAAVLRGLSARYRPLHVSDLTRPVVTLVWSPGVTTSMLEQQP